MSNLIAVARKFTNPLGRISHPFEMYKEKNVVIVKGIPLLKDIANKQWKKEDKQKGLKYELAVID